MKMEKRRFGMETGKKIIRKTFWVAQFVKEEKYLSEMRKKGWKFTGLHTGIPTKYEFEACEPEDYSYQLDYIKKEEDTEDYHQMYQDAGWEEVTSYPGLYEGKWYYFCKKKENGKAEVLYTDSESKVDLVKKLQQHYGLFSIAMFGCQIGSVNYLINRIEEGRTSVGMIISAVACAIILLLLCYNFFGLLFIEKKLKNKKKI